MQLSTCCVAMQLSGTPLQMPSKGRGGKEAVKNCGALVDSNASSDAVRVRLQDVDDIGAFWL